MRGYDCCIGCGIQWQLHFCGACSNHRNTINGNPFRQSDEFESDLAGKPPGTDDLNRHFRLTSGRNIDERRNRQRKIRFGSQQL